MFGKKKEERFHFGYSFVNYLAPDGKTYTLLDQKSSEYLLVKILETEKKLNLILDEMNLTYQPETEKKEPAKLVEKRDLQQAYKDLLGLYPVYGGATIELERPKKKRGRQKKK